MAERRKPSTRYRGEPPPKRRRSTTPLPPTPKTTNVPPNELDEGLPSKVKDGHALPTVSEPQDLHISSQLLDIPESGVLLSSLERSRQRIMEDIFERYWTKPSKKKNLPDFQNPPKESMVKLGTCSMIIEPHVYEVNLYAIKETQYTFLPPISQAGPPETPPSFVSPTLTGPGRTSQNSSVPTPQLTLSASARPTHAPSQHILPPFRESFAHFGPSTLHQPPPGLGTASRNSLPPTNIANSASKTNGIPITDNQEGETSADPVIQMLAARAATDHELKSLMKVVALGNASQAQLKGFQKHIDELNGIIQAQKNTETENGALHPHLVPRSQETRPNVGDIALDSTATFHAQTLAPNIKKEPLSQYYSQLPQYQKPKISNSSRSDVSAIVFDFATGTGDRFLIPRYSVLEYLPGDLQVIVSFLVIRKGDSAFSGTYSDKLDYYEPFTMRLSTHTPKVLEPLKRAVAGVDETRRYMSDVMTKMTLANRVYLATRLPGGQKIDSNEEQKGLGNGKISKPSFPPPDSLLPLYIRTGV